MKSSRCSSAIALHAGQRGAQAAVDAVAEPQVLRLATVAVDVERLGVVERAGPATATQDE